MSAEQFVAQNIKATHDLWSSAKNGEERKILLLSHIGDHIDYVHLHEEKYKLKGYFVQLVFEDETDPTNLGGCSCGRDISADLVLQEALSAIEKGEKKNE